jgi:NCS1 family nucleobase:cation symporter-1
LLGAVGGVMIADYYVLRRTRLDLRGLYEPGGPYWYTHGFHIAGLVALIAGIIPCVPGFIAAISTKAPPSFWTEIYNYAWFISFGISFSVYLAITFACSNSQTSPAPMTISENQT